MNPLVQDILPILRIQGYNSAALGESNFDEAIADFSDDVDEVCTFVDYGVEDPYFLYAHLTFHANDPANFSPIHYDFEFRYSCGRLFCTELTAAVGNSYKNYDCPDKNLPLFHEVVAEIQRKQNLSPFMRSAEGLIDKLEKQNYGLIKVIPSNNNFIDEVRQYISDDSLNGPPNRTRTIMIKGVCT